MLDDPRLLKEDVASKDLVTSHGIRDALSLKKDASIRESGAGFFSSSWESDDDNDEDEASFDARIRRQILKKREETGHLPSKPKSSDGKPGQVKPEATTQRTRANVDSDDDDQPGTEKLSLKKKGMGSEARAEHLANADADLQLLGEAERQRQLRKQKKCHVQGHEDEVLGRLEKFKAHINGKDSGASEEAEADDDLSDWKSVNLKFAPEPGKDRMSRNEDPGVCVVVDHLLEKGKEKFNRMQAQQKRREREWAGPIPLT
ncbi:hypothetical protein MLD38_006489 [Melastoma candidum]|uniref:Uncharacterized protein n=1 Tax=Melastoma candidum TaxID=119954 RepID=A0ACB9RML9_9MYRT|nr:hypothetical protein MLD38_006489 [Melastoma candidum]